MVVNGDIMRELKYECSGAFYVLRLGTENDGKHKF